MMKEAKGITLIALIITIIVLLILSGVSIAMLTGDNGIITKAIEAKEKTEEAKIREEQELNNLLNEIINEVTSEEGYNERKSVNSPKVTKGMIPIKYNGTDWVVCSKEDPEWYSYDDTKKWANIMLSDGTYKEGKVQEGQVVKENELGSMYVWIPRYAYRIVGEKNIEVNFLKGNTNQDKVGKEYTEDENVDTKTTAIVHPAFRLGGGKLSGIWVAKFEASGTNKNGQAVGNGSSTSSAQQYAPDETTLVKSLPNKISWRHITIGESQKRSMDIAGAQKEKYGLEYANSHLIRNSEWGAVAYLCYSQYGNVPKINGASSLVSGSHWYDMYTGQGPKGTNDEGWYSRTDDTHNYNTPNGVLASTTGNATGIYDMNGGNTGQGPKGTNDEGWYSRTDDTHNYNTPNGVLASTTGNATGIYDMNGGNWEKVAGYLDNGNGNLNYYGKSADGSIKYFENGKINPAYESLWDKYEVSEEEKTNKISLGDGTTLTQGELWNWNKREEKHHEARRRITESTYNNMANHKGIGVISLGDGTTLTQGELWNWNKREEKHHEARRRITESTYNNMANHKGIGVSEISTAFSFYAPYGTDSNNQIWGWFKTAQEAVAGKQNYARAWDNDYVLMGHGAFPFVLRGGSCIDGSSAGVLGSFVTGGAPYGNDGFRSVLVV